MSDPNSKIEVVGGEPPEAPPVEPSKMWILQIGFDPVTHGLALEWQQDQIKSLDMVCMLLQGALAQAQFLRNLGHGSVLQQGAHNKLQEQMLKAQLEQERRLGRPGRRLH